MSNHRRISLAAVALLILSLATVVLGLGSAGAAGGEPAEDHLVVTDIGVTSGEVARAVDIERFSGTGVSDGQDWFLPAAASGSNHPFTLQGSSNAVGALALSGDKRFVTLAGYTTAVGGATNTTDARDVARVNAVGAADTSTTLGQTFGKEKIRGAVTNDGTGFWVTGNGNGEGKPLGGMVYAPLGNSATPTVIFSKEVPTTSSNKALNNTRSVQIVGGSLYTGSEKGTAGVYKIAGLPTTATAPTNLIAYAEGVDPLSEAPLESVPGSGTVNLMYLVKEGTGIFKYALEGSAWVEKGEVAAGTFGPLTAKVDSEGHVRIYVVSGSGEGNSVVMYTDTNGVTEAPSASTATTVSIAPTGTAYRGIAFAPEDPTLEAEVPGKPRGVSGHARNEGVELSWTAPTAEGASAITEYVITPFVAGVPGAPIHTGSTDTSHLVEGLTNGTAYTFTVAAVNANGTGPESTLTSAITAGPAGAPTIALSVERLEGTNDDPTNPTVEVAVAQEGTPSTALVVEATSSSDEAVAKASEVTVTGTGATRTVAVTPAGGVGYADITLKVTGEEDKTATTVLHYAASAAAPNPSNARFFTGAADASTAIAVGDGYMLLGDDENNTIRLYQGDISGPPVKEWNFNSLMGNPEEIDIEASARYGNTIYWTGSMGNSKKGNLKPDRSTLFTTTISGEGANTELSFGGYYKGLRADLIKWDEENGNRYGFKAGAAEGQIPKELNGFNVEGMEFAPGSGSTAYVGFRAPLIPATESGDALVVPVTNINELATSGQNTTVHATFGTPMEWNLGGLSVREIRKNSANEYLIIAGSYKGGGQFALYTWDGVPADAPVRTLTELPGETSGGEDPGSWESIVEVPHLETGAEVQLVMDNGSTFFYGDEVEAKELPAEWEKDRTETFALHLVVAPANTTAPSVSGEAAVGSTLTCAPGTWTGEPTPSYAYTWLREGVVIPGAEASTYTTVAGDVGKAVSCEVTATNYGGSVPQASSNSVTVTETPANTAAPSVSGETTVGSMLTCTTGTWTGSPTPTYAYKWLRAGTAISGAESSTYTTVAADVGKAISCEVTGTNSAGSASEASSNSVTPTAAPVAPVNSAAPSVSGETTVGSMLTCTTGTWTGSPTPTYAYKWLRAGTAISGAESSTYTTSAADVGKAIGCEVTATNTAGSVSATSSNSVTPTEASTGTSTGTGTGTGSGTTNPGGSGSGSKSSTPTVFTPSGPVAPKGGTATVARISCGSGGCTVTGSVATLKIGGKSIKVKVQIEKKIGAGKSVAVKVLLPKAVREELADGKVAGVKVTVQLKGANGATVTKTITVKVKAKGKSAH